MEIVPIIIGVLAFLFKVIFENDKNKQTPKPTRQQVPKSKPVMPQEVREQTVIPPVVKHKEPRKQQVEKPLSELERLQRENASLQKKINMMEKQRNRVVQGPIINKNQPLEESEGLFTKDNIVQAVVFSEVLASPRSRNPHRASMQHSVTSRK